MKIHLSLNENTFTFVLPQKSDFSTTILMRGRAGQAGVRKEKHGQLSAYGSARRKRRQVLATREFKDVQIGTMIFPNDLGITLQLFSCEIIVYRQFCCIWRWKDLHFFWIDQFCGLSGNRVGERERERGREREREDQQGKRADGFCLRRIEQELRDFGE